MPSASSRAANTSASPTIQLQPASRILSIPGELRNGIYHHVFTPRTILIGAFPGRALITSTSHWWKDADFVRQIVEIGHLQENRELFYFPIAGPGRESREARMLEAMIRSTALVPSNRLVRLDREGRACAATPRRRSAGALLLTCRQTYVECAPLLYARVNFVFGCQRSVRALLSHPVHPYCARIPRPLRAHLRDAITQVSLSIDDWPTGKGRPDFQTRYYDSWTRCIGIVARLPRLRRANVAINALYKCPFMLTFQERWVGCLLPLSSVRGLELTLLIKMPMGYFVWFELAEAFAEALRVRIVEDDETLGLDVIKGGMKRFGQISKMGEDLTPYWRTLASWNGVVLEE